MADSSSAVPRTRVGRTLELAPPAAAVLRAEITRAHGNEVCFVADVDANGLVVEPRVVARGHATAVLAAARDAEPGSILIHNHPSGDLTPSEADLQVAAQLYAQGIGLAIVDNAACELYVVVEPAASEELTPIEEDDVEAVLAPGGAISRAHPMYEDRPTQRDMARAIARSYNDGGVGVYEAGTGTGKSVAYLVPAIAWAVMNRERTVVSTNTINLQEQLVGKDLPFLRRALAAPFRFALVKGRGNYVSIRRARLAASGQVQLFDDGQQAELRGLMEWLENTRDGSRQDLPFEPSAELWEEVASDADVCLRTRCPHFEQCFYQRSRRNAATADILVVNHHLLFSDLAVRRLQGNYTEPAVLPAYRRVVLDEAHNLEDAATEHLGAQVTRRGVLRLLSRLERRGKGALPAIESRLKRHDDDLLRDDALQHLARLRERVERAREQALDFFVRLEQMTWSSYDGVVRLEEGYATHPDWVDGAGAVLDGLRSVLEEVARGINGLRERVQQDREWAKSLEESLVELQGLESRVRSARESLATVFRTGQDPFPLVRWIERRGGGSGREASVAARAAPVDLAPALRDALFERVDTAILTSATLATRAGFGFMRERLGLGAGLRVREEAYASPFDFETQTMLAVPTDVPAPQGEHSARFDEVIGTVIEDMARASDGGLFALFTSYRSLRNVADLLRRRGTGGRWPLFVQGEAARSRLLTEFTTSGRGILLGVASFWEGVDVPGDPLRGLLITKLPFKVPGEPLTAARLEAIERDGGNSFRSYMLPHAALRLKQGFGRLIRARTDRGAIVLLDRRVLDKSYGRYFLGSLPPAPLHTAPWSELAAELRGFYAGALAGEAAAPVIV
ncbi:MAG: helicase C-terminal domain-containing protein [Longimicrobiales bacterium]